MKGRETIMKSVTKKIIKIIYFDEDSATDYLNIQNGGSIDWSTQENKEKIAKIVAEIDAEVKGGFNLLSFFKSSVTGKTSVNLDGQASSLFNSKVTNTILTDYIKLADSDKNIKVFESESVYAPDNSVSMYKMVSSYLNIVPQEQMPIDLREFNKALLGERGYYQMLLNSEDIPTCVLRFNINAFKNSYTLADLSKMKLSYYGVWVGTCAPEELLLEKEFDFKKEKKLPTASEIIGEKIVSEKATQLDVYDIVLAGVSSRG